VVRVGVKMDQRNVMEVRGWINVVQDVNKLGGMMWIR
jgi:hypothetical protein